jgi:hypothetical protein
MAGVVEPPSSTPATVERSVVARSMCRSTIGPSIEVDAGWGLVRPCRRQRRAELDVLIIVADGTRLLQGDDRREPREPPVLGR